MKKTMLYTTLALSSLLLSGCYTVIQGPRTAAEVARHEQERELAAVPQRGVHESPTIGRFDRYGDDPYRYPGIPSGYGGGYGYGGYPAYGIRSDSRYGYYDRGLNPYSYGYSPYSYGYDPYYRDYAGYYVPVGYELVTQRELDELRTGRDRESLPPDPEAERQRQLEEQRRQEKAWRKRVQPVRTAPAVTTTRQEAPAQTYSPPPKPAASGSGSSSSSSSSSQSSSESSSEQQSGRPPERTRTRR